MTRASAKHNDGQVVAPPAVQLNHPQHPPAFSGLVAGISPPMAIPALLPLTAWQVFPGSDAAKAEAVYAQRNDPDAPLHKVAQKGGACHAVQRCRGRLHSRWHRQLSKASAGAGHAAGIALTACCPPVQCVRRWRLPRSAQCTPATLWESTPVSLCGSNQADRVPAQH